MSPSALGRAACGLACAARAPASKNVGLSTLLRSRWVGRCRIRTALTGFCGRLHASGTGRRQLCPCNSEVASNADLLALSRGVACSKRASSAAVAGDAAAAGGDSCSRRPTEALRPSGAAGHGDAPQPPSQDQRVAPGGVESAAAAPMPRGKESDSDTAAPMLRCRCGLGGVAGSPPRSSRGPADSASLSRDWACSSWAGGASSCASANVELGCGLGTGCRAGLGGPSRCVGCSGLATGLTLPDLAVCSADTSAGECRLAEDTSESTGDSTGASVLEGASSGIAVGVV